LEHWGLRADRRARDHLFQMRFYEPELLLGTKARLESWHGRKIRINPNGSVQEEVKNGSLAIKRKPQVGKIPTSGEEAHDPTRISIIVQRPKKGVKEGEGSGG